VGLEANYQLCPRMTSFSTEFKCHKVIGEKGMQASGFAVLQKWKQRSGTTHSQ